MKKALIMTTLMVVMSSMTMAQTRPAPAPAMKPAVRAMTEQFRASDILGANVKNTTGDTVAEVKDLVILSNEAVLQAVLSVGGFLGIGDKLVGVPYDSLHVGRIDDKINVVYNTTKAELEGMPKFPYKASDTSGLTFRAHDLIGAEVKNTTDETIGKVDDLIIAAPNNVPKVILSIGGFLGIGEKLVAVPYDALNITHRDKEQQVLYNTTEEELKALPSFTYH